MGNPNRPEPTKPPAMVFGYMPDVEAKTKRLEGGGGVKRYRSRVRIAQVRLELAQLLARADRSGLTKREAVEALLSTAHEMYSKRYR